MRLCLSFFALVFIAVFSLQSRLVSTATTVIDTHLPNRTKIAFGSCNKFYRNHKSNIFYDVADQKPDIWVWLGDVAYIDNMLLPGLFRPETNMKVAADKLQATKNDPAYQKMLTQVKTDIGVWDDHDYGMNNSGESFGLKHEMRQVWLDFFNEPADSERRTRSSGIYESYYLGASKRLKIILTDVRWNRNSDDILGEAQWAWIESELADKNVELFVVGTGSQFHPDDRFIPETWDTKSKERLYTTINKTKASVVFISGDVHFAEILQHPCSYKKVGYTLAEITSSGLSFDLEQFGRGSLHFANKFIFTPTYSVNFCLQWSQFYFSSYQQKSTKDRFVGMNYGMVDIEWDEDDILSTRITLSIFTINSQEPVLTRVLNLRELQHSEELQAEYATKACSVDDVAPGDRWRQFAYSNLVSTLTSFDTTILFTLLSKLAPIVILLKFYGYLIKMLFFYKPETKTKEE